MLSRQEAEALTRRIQSNLDDFAALVKTARDGKAWKVLGFASFGDWLENAVGISRARGYQLINIAGLEQDLRSHGELPTDFTVTTRTAQQIINFGTQEFLESWKVLVTSEAERNEAAFHSLVKEVRSALGVKDLYRVDGNITHLVAHEPNAQSLIAASSLVVQIADFPTPDQIDDEHLLSIRNRLQESLNRLETHITAYRTETSEPKAQRA